MSDPLIRAAKAADLGAITAIYNAVIATSTAVFSDTPVDEQDRRRWFEARAAEGYPVLVAEVGGEVAGFASFGDFRAWPGYRFTVEHTVHVHADRRGRGLGGALVDALLPLATALGKHVMVAGVDADNAASLRLHERLGFDRVGCFREVGFKFDRWLDLVFLQKRLMG